MSHELKEGAELKSIIFAADENGERVDYKRGTTNPPYPLTITRMTVSEQPGQMAMVPWARVERHNGDVEMVNLATVESVELETQEQS